MSKLMQLFVQLCGKGVVQNHFSTTVRRPSAWTWNLNPSKCKTPRNVCSHRFVNRWLQLFSLQEKMHIASYIVHHVTLRDCFHRFFLSNAFFLAIFEKMVYIKFKEHTLSNLERKPDYGLFTGAVAQRSDLSADLLQM